MKRILLVLILGLIIQGISADQYPKLYDETGDVVNAYQYYKLCPNEYVYIIPLLMPKSGMPSQTLRVERYNAELYYDTYAKSTEYPDKTYYAYYNEYNMISKIIDGIEDYRFRYDEYNILIGYKCYNANTGELIRECTIESPIPIGNTKSLYMTKKSEDEYWYCWNLRGKWITLHPVYLGLFEVEETDGYSLEYDVAYKTNKRGEEMNIVTDGKIYIKKDIFIKELKEKWGDKYSAYCRIDRYVNFYWFDEKFDKEKNGGSSISFTEIGLKKGEGMSRKESLSHGVRNNKWYEYIW